jgi:ATP-dependent exoDNAse (exonuclease V) beta subunit
VVNEIAALVREGKPRGDILVLHASARGCEQVIAAIDKKLGRGAALDPKDSHPGNYVRVTTINAGTGLEAPVVFLMGLQQFFEQEHSLRFSEDDRFERVLSTTRKIYMAATRAGQRLVMTCVGQVPEVLESALQ